MKWKESDFNSGICGISAVLIFGADAGQTSELCDLAIKKKGIQKDNVFAIHSNELKEKQDVLFSESCSFSMFGGEKIVIIYDANNSDLPIIKELITHPSLNATVIITAGELRADGSLRMFFESSKEFAALPCYNDDAKTLAALIHKDLFAAGIKQITPDAMGYMTSHLGVDRGITRSFLKKIVLYVDDKKIVELGDVEKCLPDTGAADLDDFLYSLTAGHMQQTMTALDRLFYDNAELNMIVRMMDMHFKKLLNAVITGQMPRLFYKVADKFNLASKIWTEADVVAVLVRLNEMEKFLRTSGMPGEILMRDFALKLASRANKYSIKRMG